MRPHLQEAADRLEKEQVTIDKAVAAGAYQSKRRDQAISNLIKLAASEEFKRRVRGERALRIVGTEVTQKGEGGLVPGVVEKVARLLSAVKGNCKNVLANVA